jgi:monoamine oxidase
VRIDRMTPLTRRDFLRLLSAGGVYGLLAQGRPGPALAASTSRAASQEENVDLDVAIVGAGVAGTYAAWRLASEDPSLSPVLAPLLAAGGNGRPRMALFEASDRIGGRLYSVAPDGMPNLRAELGGMRIPSSHVLASSLVDHLGLETFPAPAGDPGAAITYVRGERLRTPDWQDSGRVPYRLEDPLRGKHPGLLIVALIERYIPGFRSLGPREWDEVKATAMVAGTPLYELSFSSLLLRELGVEGHALVRDVLGFYSILGSWNAAEALAQIATDFAAAPRRRLLRDGFQALPIELALRFAQQAGQILTRHRLLAVRHAPEDGAPRIELTFDADDGSRRTYQARHVVLALPRRPIEQLHPDSLLFSSPSFASDLRSVTPASVTKLFLGYESPWWEALGLRAGSSFTDLPLRQCAYLGTEGEQPGAEAANRRSLLLAGYADDSAADYWSALAGSGPAAGMQHAPSEMVAEVQRQVRELHGPEVTVPDPYTALFVDWGQDLFGGGWHLWNTHTRPWEVAPRIRRPVPDASVYICGEAWSTHQAWVEGALSTTERVLRDHLGLPAPAWLPPDHHLGP